MKHGIKDMLEHESESKATITTNHAEYANLNEMKLHSLFRVFRVFRGQDLLPDKLEKKGISPKTWYWAIFRPGKLELAANQKDRVENERNRTLKFLQFLENFSGGVYTGGADSEELRVQSAELRIVKNVKNRFLRFFYWNSLSANLFQPKLAKGIFRIFRKFFGGMGGGGWMLWFAEG
jgi:hypothetical protein